MTAPSAYLAQATRDNFGTTRAIEVIPNFVDTERFSPGGAADATCRWWCTAPTSARSSASTTCIAVFARVRQGRKARLAFLGDGPERPRIEARGARARPRRRRRLPRRAARRRRPRLRRAHVFLLPSETESFGLAALEALSCGVPVVASRAGGLPEVVREGEDGFLLPVGDTDAMAAAVGRILDDAALHRRLAATARAGAVARFARAPMVSRYEAFYETACSALRLPRLERGVDVVLEEEAFAVLVAELLGLLAPAAARPCSCRARPAVCALTKSLSQVSLMPNRLFDERHAVVDVLLARAASAPRSPTAPSRRSRGP